MYQEEIQVGPMPWEAPFWWRAREGSMSSVRLRTEALGSLYADARLLILCCIPGWLLSHPVYCIAMLSLEGGAPCGSSEVSGTSSGTASSYDVLVGSLP